MCYLYKLQDMKNNPKHFLDQDFNDCFAPLIIAFKLECILWMLDLSCYTCMLSSLIWFSVFVYVEILTQT